MSVLVRDTLSGRPVEVGENGKIGLYICGPTVYNHIHIGNARAPLFWDVVARYLRSRGYEVTLVQNITDIEDKISTRPTRRVSPGRRSYGATPTPSTNGWSFSGSTLQT